MSIELVKGSKCFNGDVRFYKHQSKLTKTEMKFSTYIPSGHIENCIIWLSGLTCTDENFIAKSGVQKYLEGLRTMIVCPDTSPRGTNLPMEHESYDFGSGASFYVNATEEGYRDHYKMYDYISIELIDIIKSQFQVKNFGISGHSMGGHGALVLGLRESKIFKSVSAFSPIVNPVMCSWGQKAFRGYLGEDQSTWNNYDATELIKNGRKHSTEILIDQGTDDEFFRDQLLTKNLENVCIENNQKLKVNYRQGYDHSYYFIGSFIEEHIKHHQKHFDS